MLGLGVPLWGELRISWAIADLAALGECVTDENQFHEERG
jgi:hypothetical protein